MEDWVGWWVILSAFPVSESKVFSKRIKILIASIALLSMVAAIINMKKNKDDLF